MIAEPLRPLARPITEFRLLDGNPRRGDVAACRRSLSRFGQRKPIVVRDDGTVEAGNTTLKAALELAGPRVNVALTRPPYASQRHYDESAGFRPIPPDEYGGWFEDVQGSVRAVLAEDGSWFVNIKEHTAEGQRDLYVKDLAITHV